MRTKRPEVAGALGAARLRFLARVMATSLAVSACGGFALAADAPAPAPAEKPAAAIAPAKTAPVPSKTTAPAAKPGVAPVAKSTTIAPAAKSTVSAPAAKSTVSAPVAKSTITAPAAKSTITAPTAKSTVTAPAAKPAAPGAKPTPTAPAKAAPANGVKTAAVTPSLAKAPNATGKVEARAVSAAPIEAAMVAKPAASAAPAQPTAHLEDRVTYQYNALGRRDPFQPMVGGGFVGNDVGGDAPVDIGGIKVVGIVWGTNDKFALVEDARGNSLVLRQGDKVMNGVVSDLKRDAVLVNLTVDGQSESVTIPLTKKGEN